MIRRFVLALLGGCVLACGVASAPAPHGSVLPAGPVLRAVDGSRLDLADRLERGPILLDFWATWCRPCERSLPATQRLHERFAERGLTVIGVSVDGPRNWARVRPFANRLRLGFPQVLDEDGALARRFHVGAVPTTVLIAREGRVVRVHAGWVPGEDDSLAAAVDALLDRPVPSPVP